MELSEVIKQSEDAVSSGSETEHVCISKKLLLLLIDGAKGNPILKVNVEVCRLKDEPSDRLGWIRWFRNHSDIMSLVVCDSAYKKRRAGLLTDQDLLAIFKR